MIILTYIIMNVLENYGGTELCLKGIGESRGIATA